MKAACFIARKLMDKAGILELAIRFAFTGFAALAPVKVAALAWKRSYKWGRLATMPWVIVTMAGNWCLHKFSASVSHTAGQPPVRIIPARGDLFLRTTGAVTMFYHLPVRFMRIGSALLMGIVSLLTPPPSQATNEKYFPTKTVSA